MNTFVKPADAQVVEFLSYLGVDPHAVKIVITIETGKPVRVEETQIVEKINDPKDCTA